MAKNIYHRDGCLFILGCVLLVPAVISFLIAGYFNSFDYKISEKKDGGGRTQYIYSDKTIEEIKEERPGKRVTELKNKIPVKSTIFLSICIFLIVYSRFVKRKEKKIIKLWDMLEKNRSISLQTLTEKFGYDQKFVLEALHYINQRPNASFTYHADTDLIYDDDDMVEWHLAVNCSKCGGVVDKKLFISMHTESFSCPYCSSPLIDEKFEEYKKKKAEERRQETDGYLGSFVNVIADQIEKRQKSMGSTAQDPNKVGVSWRPLKGGGSNFTTRKLKMLNSNRVEFRPTLGSICFGSIFAFIGLSIMLPSLKDFVLGGLLFGGIFAGIGSVMLWFSVRPVVFDKSTGYFWKGWKSPRDVSNPKDIKECVALDEILALQLISEYCSGSSSNGGSRSYYSYELNLVLKDRSRLNVFDHGGHRQATKDSESLAEFLNVPLWNR